MVRCRWRTRTSVAHSTDSPLWLQACPLRVATSSSERALELTSNSEFGTLAVQSDRLRRLRHWASSCSGAFDLLRRKNSP